ncbi:hypothetical protein HOY80DRAFT_895604, partial [Tuber brumale]
LYHKLKKNRHLAWCFKSYYFTLRPIHGTRCTTSLKPFPLSILRNSIRLQPYTNKLAANRRHNYHNTRAEDTTLPKVNLNETAPLKRDLISNRRAILDKGKTPLQGNDNLRPPPRFSLRHQTTHPALTTTDSENGGPSRARTHASGQQFTAPPQDQRGGRSNNPPLNIFDTGMEHVPELPNQPSTRKLHDQWNLEMFLVGHGEDEKHCTMLRVRAQTICQLSQPLREKVKRARADKEAESGASKPTRLSIPTKNPEVLEAIISAVHGANTSWKIDTFEDLLNLATTCWEFGCCTDGLGTLLHGRPTLNTKDSEGDHAPIEQWIFAALILRIPEMFEQATQKMVMDLGGVPKGSQHAELLPIGLREEINKKAHEITEEIIGFVSTHMSEYIEHPDPTSAEAFKKAMLNCLKSVGYSLPKDPSTEGKAQGVAHLLKALEDLPHLPPASSTGDADLCTPNQTPDNPTAPSHHTGSSNSSGLQSPPSAIPPRRARAALVIANAAVDLWDKRTTFAGKIHHFVASGSTKKEGLKETEVEKYVKLVESFQEKLREAKPKWNFMGFDLKQFQTFTDNPQRPLGVGSVDEGGTR